MPSSQTEFPDRPSGSPYSREKDRCSGNRYAHRLGLSLFSRQWRTRSRRRRAHCARNQRARHNHPPRPTARSTAMFDSARHLGPVADQQTRPAALHLVFQCEVHRRESDGCAHVHGSGTVTGPSGLRLPPLPASRRLTLSAQCQSADAPPAGLWLSVRSHTHTRLRRFQFRRLRRRPRQPRLHAQIE